MGQNTIQTPLPDLPVPKTLPPTEVPPSPHSAGGEKIPSPFPSPAPRDSRPHKGGKTSGGGGDGEGKGPWGIEPHPPPFLSSKSLTALLPARPSGLRTQGRPPPLNLPSPSPNSSHAPLLLPRHASSLPRPPAHFVSHSLAARDLFSTPTSARVPVAARTTATVVTSVAVPRPLVRRAVPEPVEEPLSVARDFARFPPPSLQWAARTFGVERDPFRAQGERRGGRGRVTT